MASQDHQMSMDHPVACFACSVTIYDQDCFQQVNQAGAPALRWDASNNLYRIDGRIDNQKVLKVLERAVAAVRWMIEQEELEAEQQRGQAVLEQVQEIVVQRMAAQVTQEGERRET